MDISESPLTMNVTLTDQTGRCRTLSDFRGKVVALFFGYTHCPDECPTTLGKLRLALRQLGPEAARVQVLFVTVDPERDTPAVLAAYLSTFDPSFLGLRGSQAELKTLIGQMKIVSERSDQEGDGYTLAHSANVFLFDRTGHIRVLEAKAADSAALVADLRQLLRES